MDMSEVDLEKYYSRALEAGATHAKQIYPSSVVTAPWVRLKCQSGCPNYDRSHFCPPDTPTAAQTRAIIDSYQRAILFHKEAPKTPERGKDFKKYLNTITDLEGVVFKDGYYKAFVFLSGPCRLCKECAKLSGDPCNFRDRARPSMEACGIDVYQTARNNGFFIQPLMEKTDTQNVYCLMLVD
jgi:predicted metal-binding protein